MKIDKVILSSDSNPMYLNFWPIVSKIWKIKFNIDPVLLYIDEDHSISINEEYGKVIKIKPINNIPVYLQNLWIRFWYPSQELNKIWIISDIDMLPISKKYFINNCENISNDAYIHLNPCLDINGGSLPACYHVAKGYSFKEVLNLHEKWDDSINEIYNSKTGKDHGGHLAGKTRWGADEIYSTIKILNYQKTNPDKIKFIQRGKNNSDLRIDRSNWNYNEKLIKTDLYADSHSIRPYDTYKKEIDHLCKLILET